MSCDPRTFGTREWPRSPWWIFSLPWNWTWRGVLRRSLLVLHFLVAVRAAHKRSSSRVTRRVEGLELWRSARRTHHRQRAARPVSQVPRCQASGGPCDPLCHRHPSHQSHLPPPLLLPSRANTSLRLLTCHAVNWWGRVARSVRCLRLQVLPFLSLVSKWLHRPLFCNCLGAHSTGII